jgi:hypothetical protein
VNEPENYEEYVIYELPAKRDDGRCDVRNPYGSCSILLSGESLWLLGL